MKKFLIVFLLLSVMFSFISCGGAEQTEMDPDAEEVSVVDVFGSATVLSAGAKVVSCYASFADCWLLSGGSLTGVTEDAVEEGIVSADSVQIVGTVKSIDLERILALQPDYVILSADLAAHMKLRESLVTVGIAHGYFRVDTFEDYKAMMAQFCAVNGRTDLYEKNVLSVEKNICSILQKVPENRSERVLLVRVYSTGMKAKTDDNLAGLILKELGLDNIADGNPTLLEDLSVEKILLEDPDYIIALAMGEPLAAEEFLRQNVENNPAWKGLSAVKRGQYHMLPKELFHYKPNERWAESYEYLAKIIYPEIFG